MMSLQLAPRLHADKTFVPALDHLTPCQARTGTVFCSKLLSNFVPSARSVPV